MKKVCHMTTVHQPFDIRIFQKECRSLAKAGYEVNLVAVHEQDADRDGVRIVSLPKPANRMERWQKTRSLCFRRALETESEVFHFHDPELIPVGLKLKSLGHKVVYDVHESHSESIRDRSYVPVPLRRVLSWHMSRLERLADSKLDAIVPATPKIAREFRNSRTVLVQNFPQLGELSPPSDVDFSTREPALAFLGGVSAIRGAKEMVSALVMVPDARLIVIGEFTPKSLVEELSLLPGWSQVDCLGWQDRDGVARALARCVGGLVLFHPLRNHIESQPNKLFEYMSAGLPVLASDFPHWGNIVDEFGCGLLVDPLDASEIARRIETLIKDRAHGQAMGAKGLAAVQSIFNWEKEEVKLLELYKELLPT